MMISYNNVVVQLKRIIVFIIIFFVTCIYTEQSILATNEKNIMSSNSNLKVMRLDKVGIVPEFNPEIKEYYFVTNNKTEKLEIIAEPEDNNATVTILGNDNLQEGLNTVTIEVESPDKKEKSIYKIYVTKTDNIETANTNLENLAVQDAMLYPAFDTNITEYEIEVSNSTTELNILAIPEKMNSIVAIYGKENLKIGDNIITIDVLAENKITSRKYIIKAHRRSEEEELQNEQEINNQAERLSAIIENNADLDSGKNEQEVNWKLISIIVAIISICVVTVIIFYRKQK